jgi:hypothetical protein
MSQQLLPPEIQTFYYNANALQKELQKFLDKHKIRYGLIRRLTLLLYPGDEGIYCYLEYNQYAHDDGKNVPPCKVELVCESTMNLFGMGYDATNIKIKKTEQKVVASGIIVTGVGEHVWLAITVPETA